jgi:predicted transcriptional regulator of viral defense system
MPTDLYAHLADVAAEQHGLVTQADARELGIAPARLVTLAQRGILERRSNGVYLVPLIPSDRWTGYMEAVLWPRGVRAVLSHETALDLYELSDVNPAKIHITVPKGHRPRREVPAAYVLHHADLTTNDVTHLEGVPIVTPERAIRQAAGTGLRPSLIQQAIRDGLRTGRLRRKQADELSRELEVGAGHE